MTARALRQRRPSSKSQQEPNSSWGALRGARDSRATTAGVDNHRRTDLESPAGMCPPHVGRSDVAKLSKFVTSAGIAHFNARSEGHGHRQVGCERTRYASRRRRSSGTAVPRRLPDPPRLSPRGNSGATRRRRPRDASHDMWRWDERSISGCLPSGATRVLPPPESPPDRKGTLDSLETRNREAVTDNIACASFARRSNRRTTSLTISLRLRTPPSCANGTI